MTSADLLLAIEARYPADRGWLHVEEAGGAFGRRVDRLAINLWGSRGYQILGFEVKVTKSDWRRELKQPAKVEESLFRFCDEWWVITAQGVIADEIELPPTWGWAEIRSDGKLRTRRKAPALKPQPISRAFLAAVIKRFEAKDGDFIQQIRADIRQEIVQKVAEQHRDELNLKDREIQGLKDHVARLRPMRGWSSPENESRLIKLAQHLMGMGYGSIRSLIRTGRDKAQAATEELAAVEELLRELEAVTPE